MEQTGINKVKKEERQQRNIYLSKLLIFTSDAYKVATKLKELTNSTVNINCINTIGMFPLIERIETSLGTLCMSIWIINSNSRFEQFRLSYYAGSSHSIILTDEKEIDQITDLFKIVPRGVPVTVLRNNRNSNFSVDEQGIFLNSNIDSIRDENEIILFRNIEDLSNINKIFYEIGLKITEDIISGEYHTFSPQLSNSNIYKIYNKRSFDKVQELIGKLGYRLEDNGTIEIDRGYFTFRIDFYRNQVSAYISQCLKCERKCKHFRKLCVVEQDQGYSNHINFDNLRALAILYSIHDNNFYTLTGDRQKENVEYQLNKLASQYLTNCRFIEEDKNFAKMVLLNKD